MSEKKQGTAISMKLRMRSRYSDMQHKHNKYHHLYREHYRTHPISIDNAPTIQEQHSATGTIRESKVSRVRTRLGHGAAH